MKIILCWLILKFHRVAGDDYSERSKFTCMSKYMIDLTSQKELSSLELRADKNTITQRYLLKLTSAFYHSNSSVLFNLSKEWT